MSFYQYLEFLKASNMKKATNSFLSLLEISSKLLEYSRLTDWIVSAYYWNTKICITRYNKIPDWEHSGGKLQSSREYENITTLHLCFHIYFCWQKISHRDGWVLGIIDHSSPYLKYVLQQLEIVKLQAKSLD